MEADLLNIVSRFLQALPHTILHDLAQRPVGQFKDVAQMLAFSTSFFSKDVANVRRLVATYCSDERNPTLPPFLVHGMFTLNSWEKAVPASGPGSYVIYDLEGTLRYVGMSLNRVGNRI